VPPLLGLEHADRIGKSVFELYASLPDIVDAARRALAGEALTMCVRTAGGWAEARWSPMRGSDGVQVGAIGVVTDITPRIRAEQALADREAHFRALTEYSGDLVCVFDAQGRATYESPSYARLLGHSLADTQVHGVWAAVHPDDRDMLRAFMRTLVTGGEQSVQFEFRVTDTSGTWHTLETVAVSRLADPAVQGIIATSRDISQRKAAEAALAENEARLRATYEALACGVFVTDPTGKVVEANAAMHAILGLPAGSCRGQRLDNLHGFTLIGEDEHPLSLEQIPVVQALITRLPVPSHVLGVRRSDGTITWAQGDAVPMLDASGVVRQVVVSFVDVSARKLAEDALRRSEAQLRVLVSNTPVVMYTIDAAGTFVVFEGRGLALYGLTSHDLVGRSCFEIFREYPEMLAAFRGGLVGEEAALSFAAHGHHFEMRLVPLRDDHGCVTGITGVALDVSEQVHARQALHESEAQFRRIVETAGEGIWLLDANFITTLVNRRMTEMLGYSVEEMLGQPVFKFMNGASNGRAMATISGLQVGAVEQLDGTLVRKDGIAVLVAIAATPIVDDAGKRVGSLAMISDVTARRQTEQALARSNRELARSNADLEQFTSVASHDLRSPLNTIGGYAELLSLRYAGSLDADGREFLALIVDAVKHMQALIDDLLAFARLGANPTSPEPVDCAELAERVIQRLQAAIRESGAVITHRDLPTLVGQGSQLSQLFQNLIGNAIKFHGTEVPRVTISATRRDQDWLFTVEDNGIGIDPAFAERIFVIFRRLHTRDEYPGTGIGLTICKKIVERHGGHIWVESTPGQGTRLLFTLPAMAAR
jgi:PAS domain S-box-containing protein